MSNRNPLKDQPRAGSPAGPMPSTAGKLAEPMLSKAERRAAGKRAAARRKAAERRRWLLRRAGQVALAIVAILAVAWATGLFGSSDSGTPATAATSATASTGPSPQLPADADPALATKPAVSAGTDELTKLTTTTLIEGKGAAAQAGQRILVNYVGVSYRTGEEFDSSWTTAQPYPFTLGAGEVIQGWDQGLLGVKIGSRVQLDIPANLAYGDPAPTGKPSGPLRFVVDVLAAG